MLKSAGTLVNAGADVTIIAVSRTTRGASAGRFRTDSGVSVVRVPELSLDSLLKPAAKRIRSLLGLTSAREQTGAAQAARALPSRTTQGAAPTRSPASLSPPPRTADRAAITHQHPPCANEPARL